MVMIPENLSKIKKLLMMRSKQMEKQSKEEIYEQHQIKMQNVEKQS